MRTASSPRSCSRRCSSRCRCHASACSAWRSAARRSPAGGRLALTWLERDDFDATGADDASSDGVVDALRAIEGVDLAALVREPRDRSGPARKVSLRSRAGGLDCSAIARERGGGGHPGAAGFSTDESVEEIVAFLERAVGA